MSVPLALSREAWPFYHAAVRAQLPAALPSVGFEFVFIGPPDKFARILWARADRDPVVLAATRTSGELRRVIAEGAGGVGVPLLLGDTQFQALDLDFRLVTNPATQPVLAPGAFRELHLGPIALLTADQFVPSRATLGLIEVGCIVCRPGQGVAFEWQQSSGTPAGFVGYELGLAIEWRRD